MTATPELTLTNAPPAMFADGDALPVSDFLPGLRLRVAELFGA
jgi:hypothetical protein